jgi:hypothetical protein
VQGLRIDRLQGCGHARTAIREHQFQSTTS